MVGIPSLSVLHLPSKLPLTQYLLSIEEKLMFLLPAESKTMNGALPPNSSETFLTVEAHWRYNNLPTRVELKNDNLVETFNLHIGDIKNINIIL